MNNKRWSNRDILILGDLYREGLSYNEIATRMDRTKAAVAYAVNRYRNVINVGYRKEGTGRKPLPDTRIQVSAPEPQKKPWWKFW